MISYHISKRKQRTEFNVSKKRTVFKVKGGGVFSLAYFSCRGLRSLGHYDSWKFLGVPLVLVIQELSSLFSLVVKFHWSPLVVIDTIFIPIYVKNLSLLDIQIENNIHIEIK